MRGDAASLSNDPWRLLSVREMCCVEVFALVKVGCYAQVAGRTP